MSGDRVEPFARAPGAGLTVENPVGGVLTFKAMSGESGSAVTAIETTAAPCEGPPLHVHHDQDETIYALEGQFLIKLGDEVVDAPSGSFVFIPRGTPHTWRNVGDRQARFFATVTPADRRFEHFFVRYSELPEHERGPDAFARIAAETKGLEVVGPPLGDSARP
jgi:quercetin dioxygenase-like cupin family protein